LAAQVRGVGVSIFSADAWHCFALWNLLQEVLETGWNESEDALSAG
jgi:hypothetical protein